MEPTLTDALSGINTLWVALAACLVFFMQAGFLLLEVGLSRPKNVGAVVPKVLANLSISSLAYWAVGFGLAFGGAGWFAGTEGTFLGTVNQDAFPAMAFSDAAVPAKFFFQFSFCAVSLAIVWGSTLERMKLGAVLIYATVFSALIYPIASHWVFGGGWLQASLGMQDFAGSTAVHLVGATGALAALLLLGPRRNRSHGFSMPLVGLGVLILWLGWFGFNGGSGLGATDGRFAEIIIVTNLAAAAGVLGAMLVTRLYGKVLDIGMVANGAIAGLVGITAGSGYVEYWAAPIIGLVAGGLVVVSIKLIDRKLDDPVGALSAHGLAGIWGTLACGLFTAPRLAELNAVGEGGLLYTGSLHQLGVQGLGVASTFIAVFGASYGVFWLIRKSYGLRVPPETEDHGLDLTEHGWSHPTVNGNGHKEPDWRVAERWESASL